MARWKYTDRRPPNHVEQVHKVNFTADELELLPETLHQRVTELLDEARRAVAAGDFNVWRIGEICIRWRAGRVTTQHDRALVDSGEEVTEEVPHLEDGFKAGSI